MPPLVTPPNPTVSPPSPESAVAPLKVNAGRFGELEHHELLQLLDTIDDERSRSRFRESIYISVFVYLALAWFVFYGPRVLFHQGKIILPADAMRQHEKELTYLNLPKDLAQLRPKTPKASAEKPPPRPTLDRKALDQLKAMRRPSEPAKATPQPLPATPQPQAPAPPPPVAAVTPQPRPVQPTQSAIPDAPRPNFSTPSTVGQSMRDLAAGAAKTRGSSDKGLGGPVGRTGASAGAGVEILSDQMGVNWEPYIKRLLIMIRAAWIPLLPEETQPPLSKEGMTLIRFRIEPDGRLSYMHLDDSTQDQAIDKAAWGSIKSLQGQYPPLPAEFKGPNLDLRIQFNITQERRDGRH